MKVPPTEVQNNFGKYIFKHFINIIIGFGFTSFIFSISFFNKLKSYLKM